MYSPGTSRPTDTDVTRCYYRARAQITSLINASPQRKGATRSIVTSGNWEPGRAGNMPGRRVPFPLITTARLFGR